jgi:hypothetical protein
LEGVPGVNFSQEIAAVSRAVHKEEWNAARYMPLAIGSIYLAETIRYLKLPHPYNN